MASFSTSAGALLPPNFAVVQECSPPQRVQAQNRVGLARGHLVPGSRALQASAEVAVVGILATVARRYRAPKSSRPRRVVLNAAAKAFDYFDNAGNVMKFTLNEGANEYEMNMNDVLGVGAQGKVHSGKVTSTGQEVAVKHMQVKHLILDEAGAAKMKLIDDEIVSLASVGAHPNIAQCFGGGNIYRRGTTDYPQAKVIVMEIVKGKELAEHIAANGPLDEQTAQHVFKQVIAGLSHMQKQGLVHRDLKVQNILVTGDKISTGSDVKLIDFGVAKSWNDEPFTTLVGTLEICPPEMAKAKINYLPDASHRKLHTAKFKPPSQENPGFGFTQLTQEGFGARLINVDPNGVAGRQGVKNDWILTKINSTNVEKMLFQANADDSSHAKQPKIVNTLMELSSDFTLEMMEMPAREFTPKVDVWAAGVVLYTMLAGKAPFDSELSIIESDYAKEPLARCSPDVQGLIAGMLIKDPDSRPSLDQVMTHPWLK